MDFAPVPQLNDISNDGFGPSSSKRVKLPVLPALSLVLVRMGSTFCVTGCVYISAVRKFGADELDETYQQYLSFIARPRESACTNDYVVWTISSCHPIRDTLNLADDEIQKHTHHGSSVSKHAFTVPGRTRVLAQSFLMHGRFYVLSSFFGKEKKPVLMTMLLSEDHSRLIFANSSTELVTPKKYAYHMGLAETEIGDAAVVPPQGEQVSADNAAGDSDDQDASDSEADDKTRTNKDFFPFPAIVSAMKLSRLLRNAENIKAAVSAAVLLSTLGSAHEEVYLPQTMKLK